MGDKILYRIASINQSEEIIKVLFDNFYTDGPISGALKLYDGQNRDQSVINGALKIVKENLSIVAIDGSNGKIIGFCGNGLAEKEVHEKLTRDEFVKKYQCPKKRIIVDLVRSLNEKADNVFQMLNTDLILDIHMLTVDHAYRGKGIAYQLIERSIGVAKALGIEGAKAEATGNYSRKAFLKSGFQVVTEIRYDEYVAPNGEKVFEKIAEVHGGVTFVIKKL